MYIKAFQTHPIYTGESLIKILDTYVPPLEEESILAITSKIISLCENRVIAKQNMVNKDDLIRQEAEAVLENQEGSPYGICLTLTNGRLIPSAGIDESNGNDCYILYPADCQASATLIWNHLRERDKIQKLGIIITDSSTSPLRRGVTGISLGWCGFEALYTYIGKPDIFGSPLRVTQINNLDALATAAVFAMGEGAEQTPVALLRNVPRIQFLSHPPTLEEMKAVQIPLEDDIYGPLLKKAAWSWRQKN
jgi:putative folate metabolism gamma-glutamate ligase